MSRVGKEPILAPSYDESPSDVSWEWAEVTLFRRFSALQRTPGATRQYAKLAVMKRLLRHAAFLVLLSPSLAAGQEVEAVGTRALGMGGAFVGVADDATAIYWNPGGLAAGAYFSLVLDRSSDKSLPDNDLRARGQSGTMLALTTPALGIGYYRLRTTALTPIPTAQSQQDRNFRADGVVRVDTLVTHHAGVTLVQSLTSRVAVGATLKLVRGIAGSSVEASGDADALLDGESEAGAASTRFDTDVGVMAALRGIRAGLTVRNLRQPEFEAAGGGPARKLERQARAGVSVTPLGVLLAADVDLTRTNGPFGAIRNVAAGTELRIVRRATVRAGFRVNTIADAVHGRSRAAAFGGSFAVTGSAFIDAQLTRGSEAGSEGWGIAGRIGF